MHDYLTICERAARAGGKVILDCQNRIKPREKAPKDLVSEADLSSQRVIRSIVLDAFPEHGFLGEEDDEAELGQPAVTEYRWIVDPLDGTVNYCHRLPGFAVSVALERQGQLLAGVIFDPLANECYSAATGCGAFLNGRPIAASRCTSIASALVAASLPANVSRDSEEIDRFVTLLIACQSVRRLGSAALNLAYMAAGRLDAYWATSVKIWDVAAGLLLVREAGASVTGVDGHALELERPRFLAAATPELQAELLAALDRKSTAP